MPRLTLEETERRLSSSRPLFFSSDIEINSLGDVIYNLFFTKKQTETFLKDKDNELYPQSTGYYRTREDTYLLAKSYIKDITFRKVNDAIDSMYYLFPIKGNKIYSPYRDCFLVPSWCCTINRRVHTLGNKTFSKEILNNHLNELNLNIIL